MKKGNSLSTLQKQNDYKETHKQLYANKLIRGLQQFLRDTNDLN